jgi:hypothetical protein
MRSLRVRARAPAPLGVPNGASQSPHQQHQGASARRGLRGLLVCT